MSRNKDTALQEPPTFQDHLMAALARFHQTEWLGEHSPLSAPYFLGHHAFASSGGAIAGGAIQRGQTLQRVLRQATDWLATQGAEAQESSRLIRLAYLQGMPLTADEAARQMNLSRATYYRRREQALGHLAAAFIRQINPALRLERPARPALLIGREAQLASCQNTLQTKCVVSLSGPAGVGKTTLGAALMERLAARRVFWFTIAPGLNDHLRSVLFALGFFLWQQGAASLWGQLAADRDSFRPDMLLGLVRADLATLGDAWPILCFDEIDLLRPDQVEAHQQIVAFLSQLRGLCALLLIGQRALSEIQADVSVTLDGLDEPDMERYLTSFGIVLSPDERRSLAAHTGGNPRLLDLFVSLQRSGEPIGAVLQQLQMAPSIEFMLNRIRQHLSADEQAVLDQLAVFRRPAPADAWPALVCAQLVERRLLARDAQGGLTLLPALRAVLYDRLRPEARRSAHLQAARIRAERAEYTAAAYHYLRAGEAGPAVWLWHAHRAQEINQGQGSAALALFEQIDPEQWTGDERDALTLILAELRKLAGQDPSDALKQSEWQSPVLEAQGKRLEGDLAELGGRLGDAIAAYQAGLATVENLLAEKSLFDKNLGWVYMRQGGASLDLAWEKACLVRFEAERLQGDIQARRGDFAQAEAHYTQALALAQSFNHVEGQAKTRNHLATLLARQGRLDQAREHRAQAIALFAQMGNQVHLAGAKLNMAFDHNLVGQQQAVLPPAAPALAPVFEQAAQMAAEALALFQQLGQSRGQVIALQNLAEANLYLGRLDEAEQSARRVAESQTRDIVPDGLRTLGEVKLGQGDCAEAESLVRQSIEKAQGNDDRYLEAYGWRTLARIQWASGQHPAAQTAFDKALELFEALGLAQELSASQTMWQRITFEFH